MTKPAHIIHRQVFDLTLPQQQGAYELQTAISLQYQQQVLPKLSAWLDKMVAKDVVVRLDRLEIDLGTVNLANFEKQLLAQLQELLTEKYQMQASDDDTLIYQSATKWLEAFWYFLENGSLPWWVRLEHGKTLEVQFLEYLPELEAVARTTLKNRIANEMAKLLSDLLVISPATLRTKVEALMRQPNAIVLHRLIAQSSDSFLDELLIQVYHLSNTEFESILHTVQLLLRSEVTQMNRQNRRMVFWILVIAAIQSQTFRAKILEWRDEASTAVNKQDLSTELESIPTKPSAATTASSTAVEVLQERQYPSEPTTAVESDEEIVTNTAISQKRNQKEEISETAAEVLQKRQHPSEPTTAVESDEETVTNTAISQKRNQKEEIPETAAEVLQERQHPSEPTTAGESAEETVTNTPIFQKRNQKEKISETTTIGQTQAAKGLDKLTLKAVPKDGYYIQNAGLVLVSPYLGDFFKQLGWIEQRQFASEATQQSAILMLEFLATAELEAPEYQLILNKILCGWALEATLPRRIHFTEAEKQEATELLEAVIQNWSVLKNTSVVGLRETFLQRQGKLTFQESSNTWLLQVEHKPFDILLSQLPWGYSMIKHSWMTSILRVEWA